MRAMLSRPRVRLTLAFAVVLVAASALAFASSGDAVRATTARVPGLIAFARWDGIYVVRADGSGERALRRGGAAAGVVRLAWSPDGRRIAFTNGRNGLWVMNADGSHSVRLVSRSRISAKILLGPLTWSPDGRRIGFTAIHEWAAGESAREWDIYLVTADGKNAQRLRRTLHSSEFDVDWSPAGDRIAVTDFFGWVFRLRLLDTTGRVVRTVNPGRAYELAMPDWSPDGRRLAFMGWPSAGGSDSLSGAEIWTMDPNGRWLRLTWNTVVDSAPAWSPDGGRIAFLRGRSTNSLFLSPEKRGTAEIYVMNADGSGVTRLTYDDSEETSPTWQPLAAGVASVTDRSAKEMRGKDVR